MQRRRRILVLLTDAFGGYGGIAAYNREMLAALAEDPTVAEVVVVPRLARLPIEDLPSRIDFDCSGLAGPAAFVRTSLRRAIAGGPFDFIYCGHINLTPLAWLLARVTRRPWLLGLHGVEAWTPSDRAMVRFAAKRADRVMAVSQLTIDRFVGWTRVDPARCRMVPNTIDLDAFAPGPRNLALARRFGVEGRRVILTLGRLASSERYKGFDEILQAMPALAGRHPDLVYMVAGDGDDMARLRAKVDQLGIGDRVVFTGMVEETEKADLYRLADVYAMPSWGEGFGIVFLEAMASGVPVIASAGDGGREAVRDGALGQIVDPDDPAALEAAIEAALAMPKLVPEGLDFFGVDRFRSRMSAAVADLTA